MTEQTPSQIEALLPLKPMVFQILLTLVEGERHGWSVVRELEGKSPKKRIFPGTFYRILKSMVDENLIEDADAPPDVGSSDAWRRYFCITDLGIQTATAEARRLQELVRSAEAKNLVPAAPDSVS